MSKLLWLAAVVFPAGGLRGATILSGNLDELARQLGVTTTVAEFAEVSGYADVVTDGFLSICSGTESGNCLKADDNNDLQPAPVSLEAGLNFLSFDLTGAASGSVGDYTQTFLLQSWSTSTAVDINRRITVPLTTPSNLIFENDGLADRDLIDNLGLTAALATPEPGNLILVSWGLLAVAFRRLRRFRTNRFNGSWRPAVRTSRNTGCASP